MRSQINSDRNVSRGKGRNTDDAFKDARHSHLHQHPHQTSRKQMSVTNICLLASLKESVTDCPLSLPSRGEDVFQLEGMDPGGRVGDGGVK